MAGPSIKPYSMSEIKSKLLQPALTSHFICRFSPPETVNNFLSERLSAGFTGGKYVGETQELIELSWWILAQRVRRYHAYVPGQF